MAARKFLHKKPKEIIHNEKPTNIISDIPGFVHHALGQTLGTVIDPILQYVDVNGIVRRIHIDDLVDRMDMDAVVDRMDVEKVLDRVDLNRQLDRIDIDALLERIDINQVVRRSDMGAVVTRSTTGLFTPLFDALRAEIVNIDLFLSSTIASRFRIARHDEEDNLARLPPRPGDDDKSNETNQQENLLKIPKGRMNRAIAVQGRYSGFVSKAVAIFVDMLFVTVNFAFLTIFMGLCWIMFLNKSLEQASKIVSRENLHITLLYGLFVFSYFYLSVKLPTSQTLGMLLVGIKLRNCDGSDDISANQLAIRTATLPLSLTIMPLLGLVGFFRRDGRMLHDLVAGTGMVYSWDARMAKARCTAAMRAERMQGQYSDDDDYDISDEGGNHNAPAAAESRRQGANKNDSPSNRNGRGVRNKKG